MKYLYNSHISINKLIIHEFLGVDGEKEINFDNITEIIGDNGVGKTTVMDAIAFAFVGTDAFGSDKNRKFLNTTKGGDLTFIEVEYTDCGRKNTLKRIVKYSKKGSASTSIFFNHKEFGTTSFSEYFDKDVFLSILNPKYLTNLDAKSVKSLLLKYQEMKGFNNMEVLSKMDVEDMELLDELITKTSNTSEIKDMIATESKELREQKKNAEAFVSVVENKEVKEEQIYKYVINGHVFETEDLALDYCVDNLAADPSAKNVANMQEFICLKEARAKSMARIEDRKKELEMAEKMKDKIDELTEKIKSNEKIVKALDAFDNKVIENLSLNKHSNLECSFKNEYGKEVFEVKYNGVKISSCSFAEQIKGGLELADYISDTLNISLPVVVDNAECITALPTLKKIKQIVSLTVVKGQTLASYEGDTPKDVYTMATLPKLNYDEVHDDRRLIRGFNLDIAE